MKILVKDSVVIRKERNVFFFFLPRFISFAGLCLLRNISRRVLQFPGFYLETQSCINQKRQVSKGQQKYREKKPCPLTGVVGDNFDVNH